MLQGIHVDPLHRHLAPLLLRQSAGAQRGEHKSSVVFRHPGHRKLGRTGYRKGGAGGVLRPTNALSGKSGPAELRDRRGVGQGGHVYSRFAFTLVVADGGADQVGNFLVHARLIGQGAHAVEDFWLGPAKFIKG